MAQIIELQDGPHPSYSLNDGTLKGILGAARLTLALAVSTNLYLLVALDTEHTLAKLSYISDGRDISEAEVSPLFCFLKSLLLSSVRPVEAET